MGKVFILLLMARSFSHYFAGHQYNVNINVRFWEFEGKERGMTVTFVWRNLPMYHARIIYVVFLSTIVDKFYKKSTKNCFNISNKCVANDTLKISNFICKYSLCTNNQLLFNCSHCQHLLLMNSKLCVT